MSHIIAHNILKQYGSGNSRVDAVHHISFQIESGEFVGIMGESGAGKSTLLSIMGAMNAPTAGSLLVDGIDIYRLKPDQRADFRREFLGFVFQSFHLIPYLSVMENVMLPLATVPDNGKIKKTRAMQALTWVGLASKGDRLPDQISGGEQERVAIARAIVNDPPILLADEPTGNLDSKTSEEVMGLLQRLNQGGTTVIMVTHNPRCAAYARRILKVSDGCLAENN